MSIGKSIKSCKDPENINRWVKFYPGMCDSCMAICCTLIVEVTGEDLIRLELTDEEEVTFGMKGLIKRLKKDKIIRRYNSKSGKFVLEQNKGRCIFLNYNKRCREYENRPAVCRNHPEKAGSRIGYCPYVSRENP